MWAPLGSLSTCLGEDSRQQNQEAFGPDRAMQNREGQGLLNNPPYCPTLCVDLRLGPIKCPEAAQRAISSANQPASQLR